MGLCEQEDQKRKMLELALAHARHRISPQTGFVHGYLEQPFLSRQDTIPLFENFVYAYALVRSRLVENVQEAKALFEKLLAFECKGNFPLYLHEFPHCKDPQASSLYLPVLLYLLRDFSSVLGGGLSSAFDALSKRVISHLQSLPQLSKGAQKKVAAFTGTFHPSPCHSILEWIDECICYQMSSLELSFAREIWDPSLHLFIGPLKERDQEKLEPAVSLLDLFMGEAFQSFSLRAQQVEHPVFLRAALVQPIVEKSTFPLTSFRFLSQPGQRQKFFLYFKGKEQTHSLVFESKEGDIKMQEREGGCTLFYSYSQELPTEETSEEWAFYLNASEQHSLSISGEKATVFQAGEELLISSSFLIRIRIEEIDLKGMGHLSKGNRCFQKGQEDPYECYDWKIGWRTLKRKQEASLKIEIDLGL